MKRLDTDRTAKETWANVFARALADTGSLVDALDAYYQARRGGHNDVGAAGVNDLVAAVAGMYQGLRPQGILGRAKDPQTVEARWLCWEVLSARGVRAEAIAAAFGVTDIAVFKARVKFKGRAAASAELRARVEWLMGNQQTRRTA